MALNKRNIIYWYKMLSGSSINHVNQSLGSVFVPGALQGYPNDFRLKVTMQPELLANDALPLVANNDGDLIYFPVAIFQYGLGTYDLYLENGGEKYIDKFWQCINWAMNNQGPNGSWDNFSMFNEGLYPYSAMCQGEGASLLLRAYSETKDGRYLEAAKKSIDFMLLDVKYGGVCEYDGDYIYMKEYVNKPTVLNGWIFALWGLYDLALVVDDNYNIKYHKCLNTLIQSIHKFDNGYWSYYSFDKKIASPFYHNLHIAQMQAMYKITGDETFRVYENKFRRYNKNLLYKTIAFVYKAIQKIKE